MIKKFFLFAGDQKIEHLNKDFYGEGVPEECSSPEHMFKIASRAQISAFATQLGLIEQYGKDFRDVPYLVKLNSKTDLVKDRDPVSRALHLVEQVVEFKKKSGLNIMGVGYTVYLGSDYEHEMLTEASQIVFNAHKAGLLAVLWMYPRGKSVPDELDPNVIAGAAGVAACLGADYVKVNPPKAKDGVSSAEALKQAVKAAGKTGVICSGGSKKDKKEFLKDLHDQVHLAGTVGCAVGRNIHQREEDEAVEFSKEIHKVVFDGE